MDAGDTKGDALSWVIQPFDGFCARKEPHPVTSAF